MYLYHFGFRKFPFSLTPDTGLYCSLPHHKEALNTLHFALSSGEAFCKVTGEVGSGKTLLSRLLINKIGQQRLVAYLPNPVLNPRELKLALAHELNLKVSGNIGEELLIPKIQQKLVEECKKKGPVILIIDEAQSMPDETLEALRLFTNLETETHKLLQIVLFAQPELDRKLQKARLRQLRQRVVFSYQLGPLNEKQIKHYLQFRIDKVSEQKLAKFSNFSVTLLALASRGIPRLVNVLAHKSLMLTYGTSRFTVKVIDVWRAALDTEDTLQFIRRVKLMGWSLGLSAFSGSALAWWVLP